MIFDVELKLPPPGATCLKEISGTLQTFDVPFKLENLSLLGAPMVQGK